MSNPKLIATPFAENGDKNSIPETNTDPSNPQLASMSVGFPPVTQQKISEGGIPPERDDFNGILNLYGQHLVHLNKGLPYEFDQDFANLIGGYPLNSRLMLSNGDIVQSTVANNINNPNSNMTGWIKKNDIIKVESISEVLEIENPQDGMIIYAKGFRKPSNLAIKNPYKGGGYLSYSSNLSSQNDGISIFNGWIRLNINEVTPEMAGAYADFVTDDENAFVKAQTLARDLRLPLKLTGLYAKSKPLVLLPWDTVIGTGNRATRIRKIGNLTSGLSSRQAPEKPVGTLDEYDVDACLIFYPYDNEYASNINIKDIYFEHGEYGVNSAAGYGLYAPRHAVCNTENLQFDNVLTAFYAKNLWNNSHKRFTSVSGINSDGSKSGDTAMVIYDGDGVYTGTSNIFEHFLFNNFKSATNVQNLQTSEFIACYGENISNANGTLATTVWLFVNPHEITLNACGQESSYGTPLSIRADSNSSNCSIVLNGFQAVWGTNGTTTEKYLNLFEVDGNVKVVSNGSNFKKGSEGLIFDGFYLGVGSTLINNGSSFGASSVQQAGSKYIDISKSITEKDGFLQKTKDIGSDMNNGWEDKAGLSVKPVYGATINIPSGFSDVYGVSSYYGLNSTEGIQFFMQIPSGTQYKRTRTGANTATPWIEL